MGFLDYFRFVAALAFVLGLIGILYVLARQYGSQRFGLRVGRLGAGGRLAVVEIRPIDARRRLVLVRRDDVEHLLLIGADSDVVVEAGIPAKPSFDQALTASDDKGTPP